MVNKNYDFNQKLNKMFQTEIETQIVEFAR